MGEVIISALNFPTDGSAISLERTATRFTMAPGLL
jgi:hypothetical protein